MSKHTCDRRALLRLGGVTALGLATAPFWQRRRVSADPGPLAKARRLLIINLSGGVRASSAFHSSALPQYNPYGLIGAAAPFALGSLLDDHPPGTPPVADSDYVMGSNWNGVQIPKLRDSAGQFSVLGTWSQDRGDHLRARIEEPTGSASGAAPGLLTRVAAAFADSVPSDIPPFHVSPAALFGAGQGELTTFVPVSLAGYYSLPSAANLDPFAVQKTGHGFASDEAMRDAFDQYKVANRHSVAGLVTRTMNQHRRDARTIGARLAEDDMAVATASLRDTPMGTVDLGGGPVALTNGMLFDLMMRCLGPNPAAQVYSTQAINAALAVRLLQLGSPGVCLELSNFDFHSGERTQGPPLYNFLGRLWATLRWLLARVPDPSGDGSLLDRTLVVTMSDFGRDKGGPSGFNGGEGSDHGADYACFYLSHAVMGAGTSQGRLVGPVDTNSYDARNQAVRYNSEELLVTMLWALGFDPANEEWGLPTGGSPIMELWP